MSNQTKFAVGDRVRAWKSGRKDVTYNSFAQQHGEAQGFFNNKGTVVKTWGQIVQVQMDANGELECFYPEQCRRLKKKKPQHYWLVVGHNDEVFQAVFLSQAYANEWASLGLRAKKVIKVKVIE